MFQVLNRLDNGLFASTLPNVLCLPQDWGSRVCNWGQTYGSFLRPVCLQLPESLNLEMTQGSVEQVCSSSRICHENMILTNLES